MKKGLLTAGYIIYIIGVIAGAAFAAPVPAMWKEFTGAMFKSSSVPGILNTPYLLFGVAIVLVITGAVMIRHAYKPQTPKKEDAAKPKQDRGAIQDDLEDIYKTSLNLFSQFEKEEISPEKLKGEVEKLLTDKILVFAEKRQFMINILGLGSFAEIFVPFANGERSLNRVWSALADGVPEEALDSFEHTVAYFEEAYGIIGQVAKKKGTGPLI